MGKIAVAQQAVNIPDGVELRLEGTQVVVRGPQGELRRELHHPRVTLAVDGKRFTATCELPKRKEKALVGTYAAHVANMVAGVRTPFEYRMKTVYSHFPIKTAVKGAELVIDNFLGERHPRRARIVGASKVTVKGDEITVVGPDVEAVGQTAANIELATRVRGKDRRVFQDGIYITSKGA